MSCAWKRTPPDSPPRALGPQAEWHSRQGIARLRTLSRDGVIDEGWM
jgi:hypothetical protein